MWVVYDHPRDFPFSFVARRWSGGEPTTEVIESRTLDSIRLLLAARGLVSLARHPDDEPQIVETWI